MGKITSRRHKYHLAAKKREQNEQAPYQVTDDAANNSVLSTLPLPEPTFNPFAGLKINPASLNIPPPEEWDRKTVVSIHKEATKGKNKKEKARMRKELILRKLEATRDLQLALQNKKRREQTVITKDLQPLLDALPSVDLIHHEASERTKKAQLESRPGRASSTKVSKDRNSMKASRKQKELLKDLNTFNQVIGNEQFKANPAETVLNHLKTFVSEQRWNTERNHAL